MEYQHRCGRIYRLKNNVVKILLRLFILSSEQCEHFNYAFMSENT